MTHSSPDGSDIVIPLLGEDVSVDLRKVERNVSVKVRTIGHEHLIDELLHRESVEIERVTINRPTETIPPVREEGDTTIISVVEEVLVVERKLVVKEEIHLRRVRTTERHRETVTLRQQHATVERTEPGESRKRPSPEFAPVPKPQTLKGENE